MSDLKKEFEENEARLWACFREGDTAAYTRIMYLYSNALFKYGMRLFRDEDFIKDCIQDIFFELWNRRERITQTPSVRSYLFKSLRLRIYRESPKWNNTECLNEEYNFHVELNIESQLIEEQEEHTTRKRLEITINTLPKRQKEILYLRFYENFNHDMISQIMGLSKQSVYNLLYDAVNNLRKSWFKDYHLPLFCLFYLFL